MICLQDADRRGTLTEAFLHSDRLAPFCAEQRYCRVMKFETKTIPVGQLMLDTKNPRHGELESQRAAIESLIASQRQKLVVLANDILNNGLSPIERLMVLKSKNGYTVVEGNRRLTAIKLLNNPALADGSPIAAAIKRLSSKGSAPSQADCSIAPSRKAAAHWLEIRHGGESEGAGIVPWSAYAANRFKSKPGREAAAAMAFLEAIAEGYPSNDLLQELAQEVGDKKITTLGRLVLDENFRDKAGVEYRDGRVYFHYAATDLESFVEHVLGDLAADIGVSQLRTEPMRAKYLEGTPELKTSKRTKTAKQLGSKPAPKPRTAPKRRRPVAKPKPLKNLSLDKLGSKTQALLGELRQLNPEKTPHAYAVLIRAILDLTIDEFLDKKNLARDQKLKKRIKRCLTAVDSTGKDQRFKAVRVGLEDGTSLYAVATLHEFMHNRLFHADRSHVEAIAENIEPFLQALNDNA